MQSPEHVMTFLAVIMTRAQKVIDERRLYEEQEKEKWQRTIWYRWFRMKPAINHWDEGEMHAHIWENRLNRSIELFAQAEYNKKMGFHCDMLKDISYEFRWKTEFYIWCRENQIPF